MLFHCGIEELWILELWYYGIMESSICEIGLICRILEIVNLWKFNFVEFRTCESHGILELGNCSILDLSICRIIDPWRCEVLNIWICEICGTVDS